MRVTGFDLSKSGEGAGPNSVAFGRIILQDLVQVDIQIMKGKNGLFVSWPSKKGKDNRWFPIVKILDREVNEKINDQVIFWYEQNLK